MMSIAAAAAHCLELGRQDQILNPTTKCPHPLGLANGGRIVMADKNGIKIADSDINETSSISNQTIQQSSSFTSLQRFKNALNVNTGTVEETPDGSKVGVFLKPVKAIQNDRGHSSHKAL
jgi:hypothetical protein